MKIKMISISIVCMLVLVGFFGISFFENNEVSATTYYVGGTGNYIRIQKAIDAASSGDTVHVNAGTYFENVYINKTLSLVGASRTNTTIDGRALKDTIYVQANWVNISGFTIRNSGVNSNDAGIELYRVKNCSIFNNNISSNGHYGIYNLGVKSQEFNNRIENNIISYNNYSGVCLYLSSKNYVFNNIIKNNNLLNSNMDAGVRIYYFSNKNNITGNNFNNNNYAGVLCYSSNNNILCTNRIANNPRGIFFPTGGTGNTFYLNDFVSNTNHVSGSSSSNWNSLQKITYYYNNTNFTNYLGNYWDDYTGNDNNGDGIGDTSLPHLSLDSYPLIKPVANYMMIPPAIEVQMDEKYSKSKNVTVKIVEEMALLNASMAGDLNGFINFTDLEIVTIDSGQFKGKGFFKANWSASIESLPYNGTWQGMLYKLMSTKTIYMKGTMFGDMQGNTNGQLTETTINSGVFDQFNSTMTINQLGSEVIFVQPVVNGTVDCQSSVNSTSEIYILQALFKGNCTGYYNQSISVVQTHVRINNVTHPYYGEGFSIISYVSKLGTGLGWTYDNTISQNVVSLTGFFTKPLWGIVFGTLDETGTVKKLSLRIIRLEVGLQPKAILDVNIWGPYVISPGMKFNYFMEFSNTGVITAKDTEIIMALPNNSTYFNNTGNGTYNNITHQVTWRQDILAKSKTLVSVKVNISWGLKKGTKIYCNATIVDYIKNVTLLSHSYKRAVLLAKDPNVKHGPDGFVITGEKLNYNIEYENEGAGIAYGVYFTDTLSEYLDEKSLKIGSVYSKKDDSLIAPPGIFDLETRTITWFVGEVGAGEGGYTDIDINVRNDAIVGTEILNYATVYFPSVPEVTRTNGIVSVVTINKIPSAKAGSNLVVKTLEEIIFDGAGSFDLDGSIINYTWDFDDGEFGYGISVAHSYLDDGNYKVKLTVTDNWGGSDKSEITVQVLNRPPEAKLGVDLMEVSTNEDIEFSAEDSIDLDGDIIEYYFDFGDGSNSGWIETPTANHEYSDGTQTYTATLSVKDDDEVVSENTAEIEITVNNIGPTANIGADYTEVFTYQDIIFDAELSTDSDGSINSYHFDFGDGTNSDWITSSSVTHQYTDGTKDYTVQLTIKDDDGEIGTSDLAITIKNRAPQADAGVDQVVDTKHEVKLNGESSSDLDGKIKSHNWDFGDGTKTSGKNPTHTYEDNGEYTVTLTVTDDDGATGKDTCSIRVNNVKPIAAFTVDHTEGDVTTLFKFTSVSSDSDGSISEFFWDFGDDSTATEANPTHQYEQSGTYSVSLMTKDDDGAESDVFLQVITISNLPPVAIAESSGLGTKTDEKITFSAARSYDLDGEIISFKWFFGDGNEAVGQVVQHSFKDKGTFTVILTITDDSENVQYANLDINVIEELLDSDNDGQPDNIDTDDDNDGMPDSWELKYGFKTTEPNDATQDLDNDDLNNLEEFIYSTDPTNPDTDGEGLSDGQEIKLLFTNANNPDTDGDGYNDRIDAFPNDNSKHEIESTPTDLGIQFYIIMIIIIVTLILAIIPIVIRKKRREQIGEPFTQDTTLNTVSHEVLNDSNNQNLNLSREEIKLKLDTSRLKGEISNETYQDIIEDIIGSEGEKFE